MPDVPERIGPYQILRLLGLGGMAQVYHARKSVEGVDLVVALKVPRHHVVMDPNARRLFLKEAHITTRLGSHPNIVQVLDVGVDGELPYMALEYVTGVDLGRLCSAMIESGTRWSEPAILWVLAGIVHALRHAWGAEVAGQPLRIVHRDISPSNVLITYEGQVKVTDFGISRMAGLDTSGSIRGKARYMPYEQIMGRATAASDLYAVGAIAWELIENKPFRHDKHTADEMYLAALAGEMPTITRKDVSPQLVELVTDLLQARAEARPQTPMDVWLALKACPGLNLVDPDPLRMLLEEFLGRHRQSGYTAVQIRIHPELVATRAVLAAVGEQATVPSATDTEPITPVAPLAAAPQPPRTVTDRVESPTSGEAPDARWPLIHQERPPQSPIVVTSPRTASSQRLRPVVLAGLGLLLLGTGIAVGATTIAAEPLTIASNPVTPQEARPAAPTSDVPRHAESQPSASPLAVTAVVSASPALAVAPAPAPPPAAREPEPTGTAVTTPPNKPPAAKPKPKPAPRATLHLRLELVRELELRVGGKVRHVTGSVTVTAPASTRDLAVRTPGSTTWHASPVKLEPGREYLVRLHAKRIEVIPLDRGAR